MPRRVQTNFRCSLSSYGDALLVASNLAQANKRNEAAAKRAKYSEELRRTEVLEFLQQDEGIVQFEVQMAYYTI